jgi:hypothetical protein
MCLPRQLHLFQKDKKTDALETHLGISSQKDGGQSLWLVVCTIFVEAGELK